MNYTTSDTKQELIQEMLNKLLALTGERSADIQGHGLQEQYAADIYQR